MCDKLVGRIDQVDAEVTSMLEKWRSVEEGGKSLQGASQKLLDERVRYVLTTYMRAQRGFNFEAGLRTNCWNCKRLLALLWNIFRSWNMLRVCSITLANHSSFKQIFSI